MKVYIAGKITGDPDYKTRFVQAAKKLEKLLGPVLNPAQLPAGLSAADYTRICFSMIDSADVAAFLPSWAESRGAALEHAYCAYIGKEILYLEEG